MPASDSAIRTYPLFPAVYDAEGQMTLAGDPAASFSLSYDRLGRLVSESASMTGQPTTTLSASYDSLGRRTSLALSVAGAADLVNTYGYDPLGRMTRIEQSVAGVAPKRVDLGDGNLFRYVGNEPTRWSDASGLGFWESVRRVLNRMSPLGRVEEELNRATTPPEERSRLQQEEFQRTDGAFGEVEQGLNRGVDAGEIADIAATGAPPVRARHPEGDPTRHQTPGPQAQHRRAHGPMAPHGPNRGPLRQGIDTPCPKPADTPNPGAKPGVAQRGWQPSTPRKPVDGSRSQHGTPEPDATSYNEAKRWETDPATVESRFNQDLVGADGRPIPGLRPEGPGGNLRRLLDGMAQKPKHQGDQRNASGPGLRKGPGELRPDDARVFGISIEKHARSDRSNMVKRKPFYDVTVQAEAVFVEQLNRRSFR